MNSLLYPLSVSAIVLGLIAQGHQQADSVPGAGYPDVMQVKASQRARQAEVFAVACVKAAIDAAGAQSNAINVALDLPFGVVAQSNSACMATAASLGRNVYSYVPLLPGSIGYVRSQTQSALTWYYVQTAGVAVNMSTAEPMTVPSSIPAGSLLNWTIVNP